jgi:hypothetical protein
MDERNVADVRHGGSDNVAEAHTPHRPHTDSPGSGQSRAGTSDVRTSAWLPENRVRHPGVVWVRASELLNTGSARIAGRGIDFEAELARRMHRSPTATRRALRERADRLPPLSEFGQSTERSQISRPGLERR